MKILLLLSLSVGLVIGQQRQTIYATLTPTPITTPQGNVTYFIQNNIGQTFHTISINTVNVGGTCINNGSYQIGGLVTGELEYSFNGVNYARMPQQVSVVQDTVNLNFSKFYRATTAYPFIRFNLIGAITATLPANCGLSIFYSGSLTNSGITDSSTTIIPSAPQPVGTSCLNIIGAQPTFIAGNAIGIVGLTISNPNSTATSVSFFSGSAGSATCTGGSTYNLAIPANSTVNISPDAFLDAFISGLSVDGIYAESSVGTVNIIQSSVFLN